MENDQKNSQDTPLRRERLHSIVSATLESRILNGELKIGDRLPSESSIAREFGVSTRAVREAVHELEVKGLVQRRHGERTEVVRDDINGYLDTLAVTVRQQFNSNADYLMQLMAVRRMIECEAIEIIAHSEQLDLTGVEQRLTDMRKARDENNFVEFIEADAAFHLELVHSTGNQILIRIYDNFSNLINEVIRVSSEVPIKSLKDAYEEHAEIYEMVSNRNWKDAIALIRRQIDTSATYLMQAIDDCR